MSDLSDFFRKTPPQVMCHHLAVENAQIQAQMQGITEAYDNELKKHRQRLRDRNRLRRQLADYTDRIEESQSEEEIEQDRTVRQLREAIAAIDIVEPDELKKHLTGKQLLMQKLRANDSQIRQFLLAYAQIYLN